MQTWFQIPATTRLETQALVNLAKEKNLQAISVKNNGQYLSLIYCDEHQKNDLLLNFILPEIPKEYEEDETEDLNMFLDSIRKLSDDTEKTLVARLLANEIKSLVDKRRVVTVFTPTTKKYIRKVGTLSGDSYGDLSLQVTGDHRGMIIWNTLSLKTIKKLKV